MEAEVRPSPIHGLGVFACIAIAAGAPVARWSASVDYRLTDAEYAALPAGLRLLLWDLMWLGADGLNYGTSGDSRYINHARPANLTWDEATKTAYANRAIMPGEELTEDYEQYDRLFATYANKLTQEVAP